MRRVNEVQSTLMLRFTTFRSNQPLVNERIQGSSQGCPVAAVFGVESQNSLEFQPFGPC